jgi:hypothetical protein
MDLHTEASELPHTPDASVISREFSESGKYRWRLVLVSYLTSLLEGSR